MTVEVRKVVSKEGKSNHKLWQELCDLISKNPDKIKSLKVTDIIRGGLRRFSDSLGQLWNSLADFFMILFIIFVVSFWKDQPHCQHLGKCD